MSLLSVSPASRRAYVLNVDHLESGKKLFEHIAHTVSDFFLDSCKIVCRYNLIGTHLSDAPLQMALQLGLEKTAQLLFEQHRNFDIWDLFLRIDASGQSILQCVRKLPLSLTALQILHLVKEETFVDSDGIDTSYLAAACRREAWHLAEEMVQCGAVVSYRELFCTHVPSIAELNSRRLLAHANSIGGTTSMYGHPIELTRYDSRIMRPLMHLWQSRLADQTQVPSNSFCSMNSWDMTCVYQSILQNPESDASVLARIQQNQTVVIPILHRDHCAYIIFRQGMLVICDRAQPDGLYVYARRINPSLLTQELIAHMRRGFLGENFSNSSSNVFFYRALPVMLNATPALMADLLEACSSKSLRVGNCSFGNLKLVYRMIFALWFADRWQDLLCLSIARNSLVDSIKHAAKCWSTQLRCFLLTEYEATVEGSNIPKDGTLMEHALLKLIKHLNDISQYADPQFVAFMRKQAFLLADRLKVDNKPLT